MAQNPLLSFHLVSAASMVSTVTSKAQACQYQDNVGIQLIWTGTPTGTFDVQVSINHAQDFQGNITTAGTFTSLTLSPVPAAAGSAGSYYVDLNQLSAPYYRIVYTPSSGTGTLDIYVSGKGV